MNLKLKGCQRKKGCLSILEYVERTANNADTANDMHYEPPKLRPIPQTTVLFWAAIAKEQFQQIMPDLGISFPPVYNLNRKQLFSYTEKDRPEHRLFTY